MMSYSFFSRNYFSTCPPIILVSQPKLFPLHSNLHAFKDTATLPNAEGELQILCAPKAKLGIIPPNLEEKGLVCGKKTSSLSMYIYMRVCMCV